MRIPQGPYLSFRKEHMDGSSPVKMKRPERKERIQGTKTEERSEAIKQKSFRDNRKMRHLLMKIRKELLDGKITPAKAGKLVEEINNFVME